MLPSIATAIIAGSPDAVLVLDTNGRYLDANPAACHLLGYTLDELLQLNGADVIPVGAPWLAEAQATYRAEGRWRGEIDLVRKDGTLAPVEAWSVRIPGPDGPLGVSFLRDLTNQRRDEAANARLAAVVHASPDAIISLSLEGCIIGWNAAAERLFGYPAEEAIGQPVTMLVPSERVHEIDHVLARVGSGESIAGLETVRRTKYGRLIDVALTVAPVRNASGEVVASSGIIRDITDRKLQEATLRQSEERFRTAFDEAAIGMALVGLDGRFLQVNPPLCELTGYTEAELLATTFQEITYPDDLAEDLAQLERILAGEIRVFQMEKRYLCKDGGTVWVRINSSLVRDEHGAPLHYIGQIEDITARKAAEVALREAEAKYRTLVEQLPAFVYLLAADAVQTPLYFSPYYETLIGHQREERLRRTTHWLEWVHPEDHKRVAAEADRTAALGQLFQGEYRHRRADGSYVWVRDECVPLRDGAGRIVAWQGVMFDITERKQAEEELRSAMDAAQAANRAKGIFLDMMSHELRTPLQAVLGYAEALLMAAQDSLTDEQREDVGYIHQGGGRMLTLINQVLDLSRMEAGGIDLMIKPFDLGQVLEVVRQDVAPQAAAKGLAVEITLAPSLPLVTGDAERVRQILLNLAGNAVKFTDAGAIRITATSKSPGGVEVAVSDTGKGIPAEALPHIFETFQQVESGLTRRHEGSGLGLSIAWKLAEQMGGAITVDSEPGVGSTFRLHLPRET